jgi:hypothetical protein
MSEIGDEGSLVGSSSPGVLIKRGFVLLRGILREIFDESAYSRFLERRGVTSSREAYAEFLREGQATRERRPRCC